MADIAGKQPRSGPWSPLLIAALISLVLAILKLMAFLMTNSAIVLGSLLDSISDSVVSAVNYRVSKLARAEADREHPFGHGGIEVASSLIQATVLALFGLYLAGQSIQRWRHPSSALENREDFVMAIGIMLFAAIGGYLIQYLLQLSQRHPHRKVERSLSVAADAGHYQGDFWYNLLNAVGLLSMWLTGITQLDGIFGLIGSVMLFRSSVPIFKHAMSDLLQTEVSTQEQQDLVNLILTSDPQIQGVHRLRTRRAGPTLFLDFHMKLPAAMPLEDAHKIGERVSTAIRRQNPRADVVIHLDPDNEPDDEIWRPAYTKP